MNHNIPVIASDCAGGNQEILKNGKYGILFETLNEMDLKVKICDFLKNKKFFFKKAKQAKKYIRKYSLKNSINEYSNLFKKI